MILATLACFFGIIIGVMAFINYSPFGGFDKTFSAGILYFISCKNVSFIPKMYLKSQFICEPELDFVAVPSRLLCAAGHGCLHWHDSQLLWKTIWELAVLLVLHNGLGFCGAHILFRYTRQSV